MYIYSLVNRYRSNFVICGTYSFYLPRMKYRMRENIIPSL